MAIIASGERGIGTLSHKEYSRRGGPRPANATWSSKDARHLIMTGCPICKTEDPT
jgi:hypothetical protein